MDIVSFLNDNWNVVVSMMLGIRSSVPTTLTVEALNPEDFQIEFTFELVHKRTKGSTGLVSGQARSGN
jgi:hypothetical protein